MAQISTPSSLERVNLRAADHPTAALDGAVAIVRWTEAYRREPLCAALGLGRTRIGVESGPAIVGDVGGGGKLDYTAHGETVNGAARLEPANKQLGSAICVGPGAAERIPGERLRPIGRLGRWRTRAGPLRTTGGTRVPATIRDCGRLAQICKVRWQIGSTVESGSTGPSPSRQTPRNRLVAGSSWYMIAQNRVSRSGRLANSGRISIVAWHRLRGAGA